MFFKIAWCKTVIAYSLQVLCRHGDVSTFIFCHAFLANMLFWLKLSLYIFLHFYRHSNNFWLVDGTCPWGYWGQTCWHPTYYGQIKQKGSPKVWSGFHKGKSQFPTNLHWIWWPIEVSWRSLWYWQTFTCLNVDRRSKICGQNEKWLSNLYFQCSYNLQEAEKIEHEILLDCL